MAENPPKPMSGLDLHIEAEGWMYHADALKKGSKAYHDALRMVGLYEEEELKEIPVDAVRSREVISVSAIGAYARAQDWESVHALATTYLQDPTLTSRYETFRLFIEDAAPHLPPSTEQPTHT
jgi:hypothetical protein